MSDFDLGAIMQQAQALQTRMADMQKSLDGVRVEGSAGAGMVKVQASGTLRIVSIVIDPAALEEDKDMLQDLITAAVNNALEKARESASQRMSSLIPPG